MAIESGEDCDAPRAGANEYVPLALADVNIVGRSMESYLTFGSM